ncbi:DoxX family protein [Paenibacillus sp. GCM10023252]|uniref:DoxX family protein n=1 Tax=Paenibacillus sp. GCM10023252 TaxID=3252649 RepID=UPI00360BAB27
MNQSRWRTIAYWVTTILGPASFVIGGTLFLMGAEQPVEQMKHLGLPLYLLNILGVWKLLGAIAVLLPRTPLLKEWAYAGFFFHLSGAAAAHALAGDGFTAIAQPLVFLALTIASYLLRPASRRLQLG